MQLSETAFDFLVQQTRLLLDSYQSLFATPLLSIEVPSDPVQALYDAPFAVVSHNTAAEPIFNYANAQALALFEFDWETFTQLPSKLSAEPINQVERKALLSVVREQGYIRNYQGVRVSKSGRRFQINNAVVWNLFDKEGVYRGQAACFKDWLFL